MLSVMRCISALLCSCVTVLAAGHGVTNSCLQQSEAQQVATNWLQLSSNYSDILADNALAPDYTQFSSSQQAVIHTCSQHSVLHPILAPFYANRSEFKASQPYQAPLDIQQLNMWHSCDTVIVRYQFPMQGAANSPENVVGMLTTRTTPAPVDNAHNHWIQTVYDEMDLRRFCRLLGFSDHTHP